jgi:hypothetical protein
MLCEKIEYCECGGKVERVPSNFSSSGVIQRQQNKKVGDDTKKFIEESRKALQSQREELETQRTTGR